MLTTINNFFRLASIHPLTKKHLFLTLLRLLRWQLIARLLPYPFLMPWINNSRLIVEKGMTGATGNYYFGLHEFNDMGFLLHFLRQNDLFIDIGANIGSYTVLAGVVKNARVISIEPIPGTYSQLLDNIKINHNSEQISALNIGIGSSEGILRFSDKFDTENHVLTEINEYENQGIEIPVKTLNDLLMDELPIMIKIDVEGFETEVIRGGNKIFETSQLKAILIELNGSGKRYGFDDADIRDQLEKWGFKMCSYDPLSRELEILNVSQSNSHNSLFVRDLDMVQARVRASPQFNILSQLV